MGVLVETYRGRRISVRSRKSRVEGRTFNVQINGQPASFAMQYGEDADRQILDQLKRRVDLVDERAATGDWCAEPHYYAPGSYELCQYGHPRGIGQPCPHGYCTAERAAPHKGVR